MPCYRPNSAPVGPRAGATFRALPRSPARAAPDSSAPQPPGVHERDEPIGSHRWQTFGHPLRRERAGRRFRRRPVFVSALPLAGDGTRPRSGLDRTGQRGPHGADREETDRRRAARRPCRPARLDRGGRPRRDHPALCLPRFLGGLGLHEPRRAGRRADGPPSRMVQCLPQKDVALAKAMDAIAGI